MSEGRIGHRLGPFIVTTCCQASGAPWVDRGFCVDSDGYRYAAVIVRYRSAPWGRSKQPEETWVIGLRRDWWQRSKKLVRPLTWSYERSVGRFTTSRQNRQPQSLISPRDPRRPSPRPRSRLTPNHGHKGPGRNLVVRVATGTLRGSPKPGGAHVHCDR